MTDTRAALLAGLRRVAEAGDFKLPAVYDDLTTAQAGAAALERPRAVDAVVLNVGRDSVFLECLAGPERTVELPLSLVPSDLRTFGRPVKIELREVGGYRSFLVTGRETQPTGALDGEEEIEDWLARL